MGGAIIMDVLIGPVFAVFYDVVKEAMGGEVLNYKPLEDLKNTLDSVELQTIERITVLNDELGLPNVEVENLKSQMEKGAELVTKLAKLQTWNCFIKCRNTGKLVKLDRSLKSQLEKLKLQDSRVKREVLLAVTRNADKVVELDVFLTSTMLEKLAGVQLEPNALQDILNLVREHTEILGGLRGPVRSMLEKMEVLEEAGAVKETLQMAREKAQQLLDFEMSVRRQFEAFPVQQKEIEDMGTFVPTNNTKTECERDEENGVVQGDALRAAFAMLFHAITDVQDKVTVPVPRFILHKRKKPILKPILKDLKSTLDCLKPLIQEIGKHNKVLGCPEEELQNFEKQMKNGAKLIRKCFKVRLWNRSKKYKYINQLLELDESLNKLLVILSVHRKWDGMEALVLVRNLEMMVKQTVGNAVVQSPTEIRGSGALPLPEPPTNTVGSDAPLVELKMKLLKDGMSMIELTAPGRCWKTTLAKKFCQIEELKGASENDSKERDSNSSCSTRSQFPEAARPRMDNSQTDGKLLEKSNVKVFSFAELKAATRNFRRDAVLGEGGFGMVFKGWVNQKTLAPSKVGTGLRVAVKKLSTNSWQGFQEWQSEVNILTELSHPNFVKLLGYCSEGSELLLVYEFVPRGSLDNHIFRGTRAMEPLSWDNRLRIAIGAARGLTFLHTSAKQVIHRNFKTSNILIDGNYNAKISGFGFDKLGPTDGASHVSTRVIGTYGYCAPEYIATGHLYVKSDVYSFGVVLLEILTGLRAVDSSRRAEQQNLVDWAKPYLTRKSKLKTVMDVRMEGQYSFKAALQTAQLALKCVVSDPRSRPSMKEVVEVLEQVQAIKEIPKRSERTSTRSTFRSPLAPLVEKSRSQLTRSSY